MDISRDVDSMFKNWGRHIHNNSLISEQLPFHMMLNYIFFCVLSPHILGDMSLQICTCIHIYMHLYDCICPLYIDIGIHRRVGIYCFWLVTQFCTHYFRVSTPVFISLSPLHKFLWPPLRRRRRTPVEWWAMDPTPTPGQRSFAKWPHCKKNRVCGLCWLASRMY